MSQTILYGKGTLKDVLRELKSEKFLLVCDASFPFLQLDAFLDSLEIPNVRFDGFTSNPLYEDVCNGVELFRNERCDCIVAVGGGSAIDVAKCIKLYCRMTPDKLYLTQEYKDSRVPLIALPTTAGTGSESTRYAVVYHEGKKQSVTHDSIIPNYAVLEPKFLQTLPLYQKKCTLLDALCQGVESWWSVNSTDESKNHSKTAVEMLMRFMDAYLSDGSFAAEILTAANFSGRAINITQTTAPHAMSYKLTSLYGLPHGHAAAVCLPEVWEYMQAHTELCADSRGEAYLRQAFREIAACMGCADVPEAIEKFRDILKRLEMQRPKSADREAELTLLAESVNPVRLKNNPVTLTAPVLKALYERIVE